MAEFYYGSLACKSYGLSKFQFFYLLFSSGWGKYNLQYEHCKKQNKTPTQKLVITLEPTFTV